MPLSCGKLVQKSVENSVEKYVQKLCKEFVQKLKVWNSKSAFSHRFPIMHKSGKVLQSFMNRFLTTKRRRSYLL